MGAQPLFIPGGRGGVRHFPALLAHELWCSHTDCGCCASATLRVRPPSATAQPSRTPTFAATEQIASHCDPYCPTCSNTSATARSGPATAHLSILQVCGLAPPPRIAAIEST